MNVRLQLAYSFNIRTRREDSAFIFIWSLPSCPACPLAASNATRTRFATIVEPRLSIQTPNNPSPVCTRTPFCGTTSYWQANTGRLAADLALAIKQPPARLLRGAGVFFSRFSFEKQRDRRFQPRHDTEHTFSYYPVLSVKHATLYLVDLVSRS